MANFGNIQANGLQNAILMYEYRQIEAWSLWQGKQFLHKGTGGADLTAFLEMLIKSGNNPIYTLKVYESINDAANIKSNTADDGSFNFKLYEPQDAPMTQSGYNGNSILSKLSAIEERLNEREEEPKSRLGIIGDLLDHPVIESVAPMLIARIMDWMAGKKADSYPQPERLAAIAGPGEDPLLNQSIEILKRYDPDLPKHLAKLAAIAENDSTSFKFLLRTLDSM